MSRLDCIRETMAETETAQDILNDNSNDFQKAVKLLAKEKFQNQFNDDEYAILEEQIDNAILEIDCHYDNLISRLREALD